MDAVFGSSANPHQLQAIQATDGPVLIIAGPGSGKTFTLVERIIYLITHKGVSPRIPVCGHLYRESCTGTDHTDLEPFERAGHQVQLERDVSGYLSLNLFASP